MSYSAVPTNYDQQDILQPAPAFPSPEQTQYSHEKAQVLIHQTSDDSIARGETPEIHGGSQVKEPRRLWKKIKWAFFQVISFLWLAPIIALLYLNIKEYIIGASAWCPFGHCRPYQYGGPEDTYSLLADFDHDSHNLLGALQFVAKILEVWFCLVATAFVFRVTMILVHMPHGLPIGYLFRPSEYAEVTGLIDPELYTTVLRMPRSGGKDHIKIKVAAFVGLTILLCGICNLMGPAVAVLLIPTLQWIDTKKVGNETFQGFNSGSAPGLDGWAFGDVTTWGDCTSELYSSQNFSCAGAWMNSVDGWVSSYQASEASSTSIFSVQDVLTISYNSTPAFFDDGTLEAMYFVPSRQIVQELSGDASILSDIDSSANGTDPDGTYTEYTRTVQSYIYRQGPILGAIVNLFADFDDANHWSTQVDDDRALRCYASYNMSNVPLCWGDCGTADGNYTRCIQVGSGWNDDSGKNASFKITSQYNQDPDSFNGTWGPNMNVNIFTSGEVAFLPNGTLPTGFSEDCLPRNGTVPSGMDCDWNAFFATGNELDVWRHSKQVTTWEITTEPQNVSDENSASTTTLAIDFSVWQAFADYSFDPSTFTNPMRAVDTKFVLEKHEYYVPNNITVQPVDPAWSLAAFAVDSNGVMSNDRPTPKWLSYYISVLADNYKSEYPFDSVSNGIDGSSLMPVVQLLSLIDFNTTVVDPKAVKNDPTHPLMLRWGYINVWAYSTDSRTSKFGIVVVVVGCLVVLAKVTLSLINRQEYPSALELLIVAMEHRYSGEFHGRSREEFATLPFRLDPDETKLAGFKFGKSF